jgi:glycosyltransferase involved in cell wall biosynthesis
VKICMLLHKSVVHDSRVRREARALAADGHEITVVHLAPATVPPDVAAEGYRVVSALPPRLGRAHLPLGAHRLALMARFVGAVRAVRPDVVHSHDAAMLAPGYVGARLASARFVYDSHELAVGVAWRTRGWAALVWAIERLTVPRCHAIITVSDGIAERLHERYRLQRRPSVIRNLPDLEAYDLAFEAPDLRTELGTGTAQLILHLGAVARNRGCETLIRASARLEGTHVLFLGADDSSYVRGLQDVARLNGVIGRVHFRPSVPVREVLAYARQADVGISLLEDSCENHRVALPNKVFEYLAAGVPVVASDLPELRRQLSRLPAASVVDPNDADAVAACIRRVLPVANGQTRDRRLSPDVSWSTEVGRLRAVYSELERTRAGSGARR